MIIHCPKCGARYMIKDGLVTDRPKRAKCRNCGESILIKPPEQEVSAVSAPEKSPASRTTRPEVQQPRADSNLSSAEKKEAETSKAPVSQAGTAEKGAEQSADEQKQAAQPDQTADQEDIQAKMEKRRQQMEDEISGRLNKAALETLEFSSLQYLAEKIRSIEENQDYVPEEDTQLFACTNCKIIFALFREDLRQCTNCPGDIPLVRGADILRQFGMFHR